MSDNKKDYTVSQRRTWTTKKGVECEKWYNTKSVRSFKGTGPGKKKSKHMIIKDYVKNLTSEEQDAILAFLYGQFPLATASIL